jgi:preprotein translocase subunit SecY
VKVDYSGVIAVIFASSILVFPAQIAGYAQQMVAEDSALWAACNFIVMHFSPGKFVYTSFTAP